MRLDLGQRFGHSPASANLLDAPNDLVPPRGGDLGGPREGIEDAQSKRFGGVFGKSEGAFVEILGRVGHEPSLRPLGALRYRRPTSKGIAWMC